MTAAGEEARRDEDKKKPIDDVSRQPTTDPKLSDPAKTPGSGMLPDNAGNAPTG
jgi:hypothetical protein